MSEATRERLHRWVESYVSALPSVCCRRGAGAGEASGVRFVVRVIGDRVHRIEGQVFDSHTIQACFTLSFHHCGYLWVACVHVSVLLWPLVNCHKGRNKKRILQERMQEGKGVAAHVEVLK